MQDPPRSLVESAKGSFAWRTIDAELADMLELEVTPDGLLGQLWPTAPGQLELQTSDGVATALVLDDAGSFAVPPAPSSSFRLYWRAAAGRQVLTIWTRL